MKQCFIGPHKCLSLLQNYLSRWSEINREIFTDNFFVSKVTNCPLGETSQSLQLSTHSSEFQEPQSSISKDVHFSVALESQNQNIEKLEEDANQLLKSPIECRGYPRAGLRKRTNKRKKGKSSTEKFQ